MFFCFDHLDGKTVALTCPKRELLKPIAKCDSEDGFKAVPINGYLFDENSLNRKLNYNEQKVNLNNSDLAFISYLLSFFRITRKTHVVVLNQAT